jgi:tetratricopeptide (TPR) repeat protein
MDGDLKRRTRYFQHIICLFILLVPFFLDNAYSESPSDLFEKGVIALQKGDLKTAEADFRAVLKEEPDNAFAYFNLGAIFIATRRIDLALIVLNRAVELKPDLVAAHLRLAEVYEGQGNLSEAIREYEEGYLYLTDEGTPEEKTIVGRLESLQNTVEVRELFERGIALLRAGKSSQAEEMFREVLSIQPQNAQAYNFLGIILGIQNRFDEAIQSFKGSLRIKPDLSDSRMRLAELYQIRGELKDARGELEKAVFFLEDREGPEGQSLEEKLSAVEDQVEIKVLMDRSNQEVEEKKTDAAIATLEEITRLYPKNAVAYFNLGNLLAQKNRFDLAEINFKKAIESEPNYIEAYQRLGQVYEFIRFFARAKGQYEKALATRGGSASMQQELKGALLRSEREIQQAKLQGEEGLRQSRKAEAEGDLTNAVLLLEQAVSLDPENSELRFRLGELYERTDKIDPAFNAMRAALEFNPIFAAAHQHLGMLYEKRRFFHLALKEWKEAESIAPSDQNKGEMERLQTKITEIKKETTPLQEKARQEVENGKRMAAIETLKKAVVLSPDEIDLRLELGALYASVGATSEPFSEFNYSLFLDPDDGEAHYRLGMLYSTARQWRDARVKYQDALKSKVLTEKLRLKTKTELARAETNVENERTAARYFSRGNRRLSEQDYRGAIDAFEKVLALYPNGVGSIYWIGTAYEGLNNSNEAINYYQKVLDLNPNHTLARQRLGFIYESRGQSEKAIQVYKTTLNLLNGQDSADETWIKDRLTPLEKRLFVVLNQVVLSYNSNPAGTSNPQGDLSSNLGVAATYYLKKDQRLQIPIGLTTQNTFLYRSNIMFSSETFSFMMVGSASPYSYSAGYNFNLGISRGGLTGMDHVALFSLSKRGTLVSNIGFDYSYDYFFSFGNKIFDATRQNIRLHATQDWDVSSATLSYRYLDNAAKLNDQTSTTHGIGISYNRTLTDDIRVNASYNIELVQFLNPDSLALLQEEKMVHRKNMFHSLSLNLNYFLQRNLILSIGYTEQQNFSNLPSGAVTVEQRLSGQASSLGDYRQRLINLNLNWSF